MLAGEPPFTGRNPVGVAYQQVHQAPRPLTHFRADIPPELDRLVFDLLAKNQDDRPPSAQAVLARLGADADAAVSAVAWQRKATVPAATAEQDPSPSQARAAPGEHRRRSRRATAGHPRLRWVAAVFVVVVLVGVAFVVLPRFNRSAGNRAGSGGGPVAQAAPTGTPTPTPSDSPSTAGTPAPTTSAGRQATPDRQVAALRALAALQTLVGQQATAGHLDPTSAADLRGRLADIGNRISKGQVVPVAHRVANLREQLTVLAQDGRLTTGGFQALTTGVTQLTGSLP